jgi:hypothetical protein
MIRARIRATQRCARSIWFLCAISHLAVCLLQACFIVAPLEQVQPTAERRSVVTGRNAPGDAGAANGPLNPVGANGGSAAARTTAPEAGMDPDDAGPSPATCSNKTVTVCDPVSQCGCKPDQHCALADDEKAIMCIPGRVGSKARGAPCQRTSDCALGLQCPRTRICSSSCAEDVQCGEGERCLPFEDEQKQLTVPGSGSCQTVCDPVSGEPCAGHERCDPKVEAREVKFSVCTSTEGVSFTARGEPCDFSLPVCEPRTGCARYGLEVCTPLCRTNADCPVDLPRCSVVDRVAAPGDPLGDCWYDPCDDSTVPEPARWPSNAPADADQLAQCQVEGTHAVSGTWRERRQAAFTTAKGASSTLFLRPSDGSAELGVHIGRRALRRLNPTR